MSERRKVPVMCMSKEKVMQTKSLLAQGLTCSAIAKRFGVSTMTISGIKKGKTWTNVGASFSPRRFDYMSMVSGC